MEALFSYNNTGLSPSPLDTTTTMVTPPSSTANVDWGGSKKLRRIRKRTGGHKGSNLNLNTNVPAFGAPFTREQIEMRERSVVVAAPPAPAPRPRPQNGNTNGTYISPSNTANSAAGSSKKSRRKKRRTRRTRSKK